MTTELGTVFVVDDEVELMNALCEILNERGYLTTGFTDGEEALKALEVQEVDVLVSDVMMPGMDGIALLRSALNIDTNIVGIMMTGHGTIQTAVEAMKSGAFDYVLKPFKVAELVPVLSRAMEVRRLRIENVQLRETVAIYELTKALSFSSDLNTVLNKVAEAALQQSDADGSSVLLPTADGEHLYVAATGGKHGKAVLGERSRIGDSISGWAAMKKEPLLVDQTSDEDWLIPLKRQPEILSSIAMPMLSSGRLVGVLNVNNTHQARPFTLGQVKALSILASIAATALDAASLFSRVKRAEEKYRTLVEQLSAITYVVSFDGGFRPVYVSPQIETQLGISAEDWIRDPEFWRACIHEHDRPRVMEDLAKCLSCGDRFVSEYRIVTPAGRTVWLHDEAVPISCKGDRPEVLQGVIVDLTQVKEAEQALRATEAMNRLLIEESPLGIGITRRGHVSYANPEIARLFGCDSAEAMVGSPLEAFIAPEQKDLLRNRQIDWLKGKSVSPYLDLRGVRKNGEEFDMQVWPKTVIHGGEPAVLHFVMDSTEEKSLRAQLIQAQKLEAVGTLAGGVAHDFNNILTVVSGFSELLLVDKSPGSTEYEDLERVLSASKQGAELVKRLLTFSRKAEAYPHPLNLNNEIAQMQKLLSRTIPKMIEIELVLDPNVHTVNADSVQIGQLLMNLAVNAKDAMPDGGKLVMATKNVSLDEEYCRAYLGAKAGDYVRLTVSDTGQGMDQETVRRIFEPFFTTKAPGAGTGLGLATVYGIVKQHGGHITCSSEPNRGTSFAVYFPAVHLDRAGAGAPDPHATPPGGTEKILVVDDEELVRELGTRLLSRVGYTVLTAANGEDALGIYEKEGNGISLVILDLVMPRLGGRQCLDRLLKTDPRAKVIISSGYFVEGRTREMVEAGAKAFVTKPFRGHDLLKTVRDVLDAR
ncbi:MAG: response regulator [Thermodesulfobacteriota bacterium]